MILAARRSSELQPTGIIYLTASVSLALTVNLAPRGLASRGPGGRRAHLLLLERVVVVSRDVPSFVSAIRARHYVVGVQDARAFS